jgi:Domain of unknown function (DUF4157)
MQTQITNTKEINQEQQFRSAAKMNQAANASQYSFSQVQGLIGNHGILRCGNSTIQPKLKVSQPGDKYEKEADNIANQINHIQTIWPNEINSGETHFSPKSQLIPNSYTIVPANIPHWLEKAGSGCPLSDSSRKYMENRFNSDFSSVRIHTGGYNDYTSALLGARAFTYKNHIFLGKDQNETDHNLLAHELVHTLQQTGRESNGSQTMKDRQMIKNPVPFSHITDASIQRYIDYPSGSGYNIGDILKGKWYETDSKLDNVRFIDFSWSEWPTGLCQEKHQIKVRVEEYSTVGFLGAINHWDYYEWYFWNHEFFGVGQEGACAKSHMKEGPQEKWIAYDEKGDAPQSNKDTLSLVGNIASIASLIIAIATLASAEPVNKTPKEAVV